MENNEIVEAVSRLAQAVGDPKKAGDPLGFAIVPKECTAVAIEELVERFRAVPRRKISTVNLCSVESFIEYFNRFADETSIIIAVPGDARVTGILDYHHAGEGPPAWREHKVQFYLKKTPEWETWTVNDNQQKAQVDFARFLEDNAPDILNPPAADILEMARDLQSTRNVQFASAISLQTGRQQFTYTDEGKDTVGKGKMEVPETFTLQMQTFINGPIQKITARLRYRIKDGKLTFWYSLLRPHKINQEAFNDVLAKVGKGTKAPLLIGQG